VAQVRLARSWSESTPRHLAIHGIPTSVDTQNRPLMDS